jgi:hypothetical protein
VALRIRAAPEQFSTLALHRFTQCGTGYGFAGEDSPAARESLTDRIPTLTSLRFHDPLIQEESNSTRIVGSKAGKRGKRRENAGKSLF